MTKLEQLRMKKEDAFTRYLSLKAPADKAYDIYEEAMNEWKNAELYEKIRKKVMRDLVSSFEASKEEASDKE